MAHVPRWLGAGHSPEQALPNARMGDHTFAGLEGLGVAPRMNRLAALTLLLLAVLADSSCRGAPPASPAREAGPAAQTSPRAAPSKFLEQLPRGFPLPAPKDVLGGRLLRAYGAVLVARGGAIPPPCLIFPDAESLADWRDGLKIGRATIAGKVVELQAPALAALLAARAEARKARLNITLRARDGAARTYARTAQLWRWRVHAALTHWVKAGRLSKREAARLRALPPREQIPDILNLEEQGLFFSADFKKPILDSVAPPGASQHLSMLALDIRQYENRRVRAILAGHGWFQTVRLDLPHFTYLGVPESALPSLGLKPVEAKGRTFWVPDLGN
jgi:hypothetical protein